MMQVNERRRAARNAIEQLAHQHIEVIGFSLTRPRPLIDIEQPITSKGFKAEAFTEKHNGEVRTGYLARFKGCVVRWYLRQKEQA